MFRSLQMARDLLAHALVKLLGVAIFLERHADGIGPHPRQMTLAIDLEAIPCGERFDGAIDARQKIVAMRLDVEADQVGAQQPVNQIARPRADAEDFRIGPGNMPEDGDTRVRPRFLDHARQQREVIVLRENDRRLDAFHFLQHARPRSGG